MQNNLRTLAYSILGISIVITFGFNTLFFNQTGIGLNLFLMTLIFLLTSFALRYLFKSYKSEEVNTNFFSHYDLVYIPLLFTSLTPLLSQNGFLNFWAIIITFGATFIITLLTSWNESIKSFKLRYLTKLWAVHFVQQFKGLPIFIQGLFTKTHINNSDIGRYGKIFLGILLSIPFLFIFVLLFASSDAVFSKLVNSISLEVLFYPNTLLPYLSVFVIVFIVVLMNSIGFFYGKNGLKNNGTQDRNLFLDPTISTTFSTLINILFLVFVLTQFVYLFGGDTTARSLGIVYSDYARRGFFEMIAIVSLSIFLNYCLNSFTKRSSIKSLISTKISIIISLLFNTIILASAFQRITLYTNTYGLTEDRFFVIATIVFYAILVSFLIVVSVLDILTISRLKKLDRSALSYLGLFTFILVLVTIPILASRNPDAIIAKFNINHYYENKATSNLDMDIYYLKTLSSDSYVEILLDNKLFSELSYDQKCDLALNYQYNIVNGNSTWQTFSINSNFNKKIIEDKLKNFITNDVYKSNCYSGKYDFFYR